MDINALSAMINQEAIEKARREINSSFSLLVENIPKPKLPEYIFKQLFLPVIAGEVSLEESNKLFIYWVSVAGTASQEIDVIDTRGAVLFTLPAVMDTSVLNTTDRRLALSDIYDEAKRHGNQLPVLADRFLIPQLNKKVGEFLSRPENQERTNRIKKILERYGKVLPTVTEVKINTDEDDDLIY